MSSSRVSRSVDNEVAMPTTSDEVDQTKTSSGQNLIATKPAASHTYYHHGFPLVDLIELTEHLNIHAPDGQTSNHTTKQSELVKDDTHATNPASIDAPKCAEDKKHSEPDNKLVRIQLDESASVSNSASITDTSILTSSSVIPASPSAITPREVDQTTIVDTVLIPTVYPPRCANIFKKRGMKRTAKPVYKWSEEFAGLDNVKDDDEEEFPVDVLQEFHAANEKEMKRKTEEFKHVVMQHTWQTRPVEDLGELFAVED